MAIFETTTIWNGTPTEVSGSTPFGLYDNDSSFISDAKKFAIWAARRLGYPIINVEMISEDFYACLEESISEFSNQVNQFNIRENRLAAQGLSVGIDLTQKNIYGSLNQVIRIAKTYGSEVGAGGTVTYRKGYIDITPATQDYDLNSWANTNCEGRPIEIKRIFHYNRPAISRYYDPFVESGLSRNNLLDEFGWAGWQPVVEYVLFPIYEDLLRVQAVEFNDEIRRSGYSFELKNNMLRIFPRPTSSYKLWFEYIFIDERDASVVQSTTGSIQTTSSSESEVQADFSNIQYQDILYSKINQPGKFWIKKYAFACAKETLGIIRSKYQQIPIPNSEISLDGETLRSEAANEKELLITQLRESLEESSRSRQWEKKQIEEEAITNTLKNVPLSIYIA